MTRKGAHAASHSPTKVSSAIFNRLPRQANALVTPTVQVGQIFVPMHYAEVNRLTHASFDPRSRQPNYKHCAVALEETKE